MFAEDNTCVEAEPSEVEDRRVEHILVIDDDLTQTEILSIRFRAQGYRVSTVHTCADALAATKSEHPDLILLDIGLPDGDGLDVCAQLADDEKTSGIPIIIVSGRDEPDVVRRSRAAGCHYYVRKPYDPNALLILSQNAIVESRDW